MPHILYVIGLISVAEISLWTPIFWHIRKPLASVILVCLSISCGILVVRNTTIWTLFILIISAYRIINLLRIVEARMQETNLLQACRRASFILILVQFCLVLIMRFFDNFIYSAQTLVVFCLFVEFLAALILGLSLLRNTKKMVGTKIHENIVDMKLPTLTVAIPARNETTDLETCLETLTTSNYPKLEIVVLDDCSQNSKTPEIIRQFAHDGVRFIAGEVPPEKWLAKNYAYEQLYLQSNGELILFCGVDVRFQEDTLREIVNSFVHKRKNMIAYMPVNNSIRFNNLLYFIIQPVRYAWEIALPRRLVNRPPVLSTSWIVSRQFVKKCGTFEAIKNSISPESFFAKQAMHENDSYSFVIGSQTLGLSSSKNVEEQKATAVRTRYPQLHRRVELVALETIFEAFCFVLPFIFFLYYLLSFNISLSIGFFIVCLIDCAVYFYVTYITYREKFILSILLLPIAVLYDLSILNLSMWLYEFKEVLWKERNVCIPIMQTYGKLPKL